MMASWRNACLGATAFLLAHGILRWQWPLLAGAGRDEIAWFTNAPLGAVVGAALMIVAAATTAARAPNRDARWHRVRWVAGGGVGAMLLALPIVGPGTIAPLAALVGAMLLAAGALFGGMLGGLVAASGHPPR